MKTVLVIGGAGFIGSNLCAHLVDLGGYKVVSLDNYFTGSTTNHVDGVTYIRGEAKDVYNLLGDHGVSDVDLVFHFGEYSRVEQSFDDIKFTFQMNQQMIHVLEFCKLKNAKLIYSGSSTKFAHGDTQGSHQSPYGWTKATNTDLVKAYAEWFGIDYAIVYFYNVYGPNEINEGKYATLIAKFTTMMKLGQDLTVVSPGTQERNFTYVGDVVKALVLISERGHGDGYGIGSDDAYSVLTVAQAFGGHIQMVPDRPGNRRSADLVTEKTKALGWEPTQNLLEYIRGLDYET